jgi:hypothetical protein
LGCGQVGILGIPGSTFRWTFPVLRVGHRVTAICKYGSGCARQSTICELVAHDTFSVALQRERG